MKNLLTTILLATSCFCFGQTTFYTTNSKNRLTKAQVDSMAEGISKKATEKLGRKLYGNVQIKSITNKKDSIIKEVTFKLSDKKIHGEVSYKRLMEHLYDKELPNYNLKTLVGNNFNSNSLKGKPTMINFWFTRCPPCIDEMPFLNELQNKYKNKVNFISITYENQESVKKFLKKNSFNFKHLVDAKKYTDELKLQSYPLNVFLDENGIVKYVEGGLMYIRDKNGKMKIKDSKEFEEILNKLI